MHLGSMGELGQIQSDGKIEMGDSLNWTGHYCYLSKKQDFPFRAFFEKGMGGYVRHPDPKQTDRGFGAFYNGPWGGCISRDQLTGLLAGLLATKDYMGAIRVILHHSLRLFLFSYNTVHNGKSFNPHQTKVPDLTLMDIWALELRALGPVAWLAWPILNVLDLQILLASCINKILIQNDPISFAIKLIISKNHAPTLASWLAFKVCNKDKLYHEIVHYWASFRDSPEMIPLYAKELGI